MVTRGRYSSGTTNRSGRGMDDRGAVPPGPIVRPTLARDEYTPCTVRAMPAIGGFAFGCVVEGTKVTACHQLQILRTARCGRRSLVRTHVVCGLVHRWHATLGISERHNEVSDRVAVVVTCGTALTTQRTRRAGRAGADAARERRPAAGVAEERRQHRRTADGSGAWRPGHPRTCRWAFVSSWSPPLVGRPLFLGLRRCPRLWT